MVETGMRVEGGWSVYYDAYAKADTWGLFDTRPDQPTRPHKRGARTTEQALITHQTRKI